MTAIVAMIVLALFISGPVVFGAERVGWYQRLTLATTGIWSIVVALRLRALAHHGASPVPAHAAR